MKNLLHIQSVRLLETTKNGDAWKVVIIEEGLSKNGNFYSSKVLQAAVNLFNKAKVCYYEFKDKTFNHLPEVIENMRPEGFPHQIAGWLEDVKFEEINLEGRTVRGLTGVLRLHAGVKWLKSMLTSAWDRGLKQFLGLSINAEGPTSVQLVNGRPLNIAQSIENVISVDIVSNPAAGGRFARMLASCNDSERGNIEMFKQLVEMLRKSHPELLEGYNVENLTEEDMGKILKTFIESLNKEKEEVQVAKDKADADLAAKTKAMEDVDKENADAVEAAKKDAAAAAEAVGPLDEALVASLQKEGTVKQVASLVGAKEYKLAGSLLQKFLQETILKNTKKKESVEGDAKMKDKLQEAQNKLNEAIAKIELQAEVTRCAGVLKESLLASELPMPIQNKIEKRFTKKAFKEEDLTAVIKEEKDTLAALSESGDIILEASGMHVGAEKIDRLQAAMDLAFGYEPEDSEKDKYKDIDAFSGIREAYVAITGDTEVTGTLPRRKLKETVDSGTFTYMLGYTINRKMLKDYKAMPDLWRQISNVVSVKDFKMQELIQWGGFGELPTVAAARTTQGTEIDTTSLTYPELGFPADSEQAYGIATKGGLVTVTRRAIINDDLRQLSKIPGKLAKAASKTLNQFVFDLMLGVSAGAINAATKWPNAAGTANSAALYATGHNNYQTTAIGYDILNTMLVQMYNQGETGYATTLNGNINSSVTTVNLATGTGQYFKANDILEVFGEQMMITVVATDALTVVRGINGTTAASHTSADVATKVTSIAGLSDITLWVPRNLKGSADTYNQSVLHPDNAENGINTLRGMFKVMVSPYLRGDQNNYYLAAGKAEIDLIEIGFLNGKQNPEILVQDQPTVGTVFTGDLIKYKVRHEYGGVVPDYKAYAASIVTGV